MIYTLGLILTLSVFVNILVVWYIRHLLKIYNKSIEDMVGIFSNLEDFQEQIEKVYSMEVYYGDATIENMINNISKMSKKIETFLEESSQALGGAEE